MTDNENLPHCRLLVLLGGISGISSLGRGWDGGKMNDPGFKATTAEYQAALFGSGVVGFGIGILVASFLPVWIGGAAIVIGAVIHGWGMWKIYRRSR